MPLPIRIRKTADGYTFPLTLGYRVLVCERALEIVREIAWYVCLNNRGVPYARSKVSPRTFDAVRQRLPHKGDTSTFPMHVFLKPPPEGLVVHHVNGCTLDNRLCNLEIVTQTLNNAAQASRGGTSKYKGVSRRGNKWLAQIQVNGTKYNLGSFVDEAEAAAAYDRAAMLRFGPLAALNLMQERVNAV